MGNKQVFEFKLCDEGVPQPLPRLIRFHLLDVDLEPVQVEHPLVADTGPERDFARLLKKG